MYLKTLANLVVTLVLIFFSDNVKGTENDQLVAVAIVNITLLNVFLLNIIVANFVLVI